MLQIHLEERSFDLLCILKKKKSGKLISEFSICNALLS